MKGGARAAVIGTGFVGTQHVDALRRIGVDVALVAASDQMRADAAADALNAPRSTGDWHAAATDRSVDVVHVCVPNDLHHRVVLAALAAGKHVICEKPLAMNLAEGRELVDAAVRSGKVAVLCHNYRFFPMIAELRLRIASGSLGHIHAIRGAYLQDWLLSRETTNWRVDPARGGRSRAIADIGTHWIDLAEIVTQRPLAAVMVELSTVHPRRPPSRQAATFTSGPAAREVDWMDVRTEDRAGLLLRFEGGISATLTLSQVAAGHSNDLELSIDGSSGSATWRQEQPDSLWVAHDGTVQTLTRGPDRLQPGARALAHLPPGHNEGWTDALRNLLAAAYAEIGGGRPPAAAEAAPLPTFSDGLRHLAFVEAALLSADQQRWVAIDDVLKPTRPVAEVR